MSDSLLEWGPYVLLPYPMEFADSPVPGGVPANEKLAQKEFCCDPDVVRSTTLAEVPDQVREQVHFPGVMPFNDLTLSGIWYLLDESGQLFMSEVFWHRRSNRSPRSQEDARSAFDISVIRERKNSPVLVSYGQPASPDAAITQWEISPQRWSSTFGLHHRFTAHAKVDPVEQRAWLQADGIEWIDGEYREVVMGWRSSFEELVEIAESFS